MKKIRWATHKSLFKDIAVCSCLVAVAAGVTFGISAGTFKIQYSDLDKESNRLLASTSSNYYAQNITSQWNMTQTGAKGEKGYVPGYEQPLHADITLGEGKAWWKKLHGDDAISLHENNPAVPNTDPKDMELKKTPGNPISDAASKARRQYTALVIDGATKTQLDRSFNQSVYNGMANFITNQKHAVKGADEAISYKPSQDSTTEFVNVYHEAVKYSRVLSLAGFSHVTPLNTLSTLTEDGKADFGADKAMNNTGLILIDGDIAHNQNIASVLFRCDQPAFLTGLATCMYFLNNLEQYHKDYRDISVGTYGGIGMPTVSIYMGGFQRGIEFYNQFILSDVLIKTHAYDYMSNKQVPQDSHFIKHILPATKYKDEVEEIKKLPLGDTKVQKIAAVGNKMIDEFSVKMIKLGDFKSHFTGSFAPGEAIGITKQLLNRGASAILPVNGAQYIDTTQEIMNQNANCIAIGVDTELENSDFQRPFRKKEFEDKTVAPDGTKSPHANNIIKFSAVKDISTATEKILRNAATGLNWDTSNKEPWVTGTTIPTWDAKTEEISLDQLATVNRPDGTIDIIGFKKGFVLPKGQHVLNIPTKINGKSVYLIRQPSVQTETDLSDGFNAETLADIDTLKISDDGTSSIGFEAKAFNYLNYGTKAEHKEELMKHSGFRYIDLSQLDITKIYVEGETATAEKKVFVGIAGVPQTETGFAFHRGIVKFNQYDYYNLSKKLFGAFFPPGDVAELASDWSITEADPFKSVCGFGFRTCGNIENGLSSISQDGWPYVVDALNQLTYRLAGRPNFVNFLELLKIAADKYRLEVGIEKYHEFFDAINALDETNYLKELCSFNKDKVWYKYYPQTMSLLGMMLKMGGFAFPRHMTIRFDSNGKPTTLPEGYKFINYSIIDWLRTNMYYIC